MKICSVCGSSFNQLFSNGNILSGKMGCPECYYTFEDEIKEFFNKNGINQAYSGYLPKRLKGYKSNLTGRVETQLKLEEAVKNEEYEKAALYRDYLKVLNNPKIMSGEEEPEGNDGTE